MLGLRCPTFEHSIEGAFLEEFPILESPLFVLWSVKKFVFADLLHVFSKCVGKTSGWSLFEYRCILYRACFFVSR